jgi:hypothetical protein
MSEAQTQWIDFFEFDPLSDSALLLSILVMLGLYAIYDIYRPTTPVAFSLKYRGKRTLNWVLIGICSTVENMNQLNIVILSTMQKEALYKTGLTLNSLIILGGVTLFLKPVFMIFNGLIIDRFAHLSRNGKFILIGGFFIHAIVNFIMGCVMATSAKAGAGAPAAHSFDQFQVEIFAVHAPAPAPAGGPITVPPANSGDDTALFTSASVAPLFFISHIIATYMQTVVELVLNKICSSWYHDRGERATISGLLNVFDSWDWFTGFALNIYIFTKFTSTGSAALLFANAGFLCVAAVCATLISKRWDPSDDYNYYTWLLKKQQRKWEEKQLTDMGMTKSAFMQETALEEKSIENELANVDKQLDEHTDEDTHHDAPHDNLATHHDAHTHGGHHDDHHHHHHTEFVFDDPMKIDNISLKTLLMNPEIYVYSFAYLFLSMGIESWYQWFISNMIYRFDVTFGTATGTLTLVLITAAPAATVMFCVLLVNLFAKKHRGISISLYASLSMAGFGLISIVTFLSVHPAMMIIFGILNVFLKTGTLTALRYQSQTLGGASKAATVTALLWAGSYIGSGINVYVFGFTGGVVTLTVLRALSLTLCPVIGATILLAWHFKHVIFYGRTFKKN